MKSEKQKKIILTGGGTGGSVTPLLSLKNELIKNNYELLWIGTKNGIEKKMVEKEDIEFKEIASGKLRRYFAWQNFFDPFLIILGFFQALFIIIRQKPNLIMSAGGFVSVPAIWAAWLCRVPIIIHQQDARAGLSNKLMAPFATVITVAFKKSLADYGKKAKWIGNETQCSIRKIKNSRDVIYKYFKFKKDLPVLFIIGGMTGALGINQIVWGILPEITKFLQIIHITGRSKNQIKNKKQKTKNYLQYELMDKDELSKAYAIASVVVSRCGMGTLTELSHLAKPAILIPMPNTHQEDNANIFATQNAAIVLAQNKLKNNPKILTKNIKQIIQNNKLKQNLSNNIQKVIKKGYIKEMIKVIKKIG